MAGRKDSLSFLESLYKVSMARIVERLRGLVRRGAVEAGGHLVQRARAWLLFLDKASAVQHALTACVLSRQLSQGTLRM